MAVGDDPLDPAAQVRKRVVAGVQQDDALAPVPAPAVSTVPAPQYNAQAQPEAPTLPSAPAPGQYTTPGTPAPTATPAPAPPSGNADRTWLDWIVKTYGPSKTRQGADAGAFADLPAGTSLEQVIQRFNQETGSQAKYMGGPSGDRVDFGNGVTDALTSQGQLWSDYGGRGGPGVPAGGGGGGIGAGGGAGSGNAYTDQIRAMLMERIKRNQGPLNEQDSGITEAMNAARLEAGRTSDQERKDLAERAYASGDLGGDTIRQGVMQSAEKNAVGLGSMRAKLIMQEYATRRAELSDDMQKALASGDAQMAREAQVALAQLDATVRREGYGIQMAQFAQNQNQNTVAGAKQP
jgi:hypothetical protein